MADEDFLIKVGLDPSAMTEGVRRGVRESLAEIEKLQRFAGEDPDARIAELPTTARQSLYSVNKSETAELNKQKQTQQKMIEQRAKLIALAQQEAIVVAKASGRTPSSAELGKIRAGGESALAASLGLDQLTPAIKGQITKLINGVNAQFAPLQNLSGVNLQNQFRQIANEILPTVGITDKASVRKASTVIASQAGAYDPSTDDARLKKAANTEANAAERTAKTAQEDAADAERSSVVKKSSRRRVENALEKEASSTERDLAEKIRLNKEAIAATRSQIAASKNISEKASLGNKLKDLFNERELLASQFENQPDIRKSFGYNPLAFEYSNAKEVQSRRDFQEKTGKRGTASGGYGVSELTVTGYSPLAAFTGGLKDFGKSTVNFIDSTTGKLTDFAKFLDTPQMTGLMDEFGIQRGRGKNRATFSISDVSLVDEFQSRAFSLLEKEKLNYTGSIRSQDFIDQDLENSRQSIRDIEIGRDAQSAEAILTAELLEAKNKFESLGLSVEEVKLALGILAGTAKTESGQIDSLVKSGIVSPGSEWVGPRINPEVNSALSDIKIPDNRLSGIVNEIASIEQARLNVVEKDLVAETQNLEATQETTRRQQSVTQLMRSLESQVRRGVISAEEGNKQLFLRGAISGQVDNGRFVGERTTLNTIEDQRNIDNFPDRAPSFDVEEQALIRALINKKEALNKQTLVLTSNYAEFKGAEESLIDALKRKAQALNTQTAAIQTPETQTQRPKRQFVPDDLSEVAEPKQKPEPKPKDTRPRPEILAERKSQEIKDQAAADQIRYSNLDFSKAELRYLESEQRKMDAAEKSAALQSREAQIESQTLEENLKQLGIEQDLTNLLEVLRQRVADNLLTAKAGNKILQQAGVIAPGESTVLNTAEDRRIERERQARQAELDAERRRRNNLPLSERFPERLTSPVAFGAVSGQEPVSRRVDLSGGGFASDVDVYNRALRDAILKGFPKSGTLGLKELEGFNISDTEVADQAAEVLAKTMFEASVKMALAFDGLSDEMIEATATIATLNKRLQGASKSFIVADDFLFDQYTLGDAENKVASKELAAGRESLIMSDTPEGRGLQQRLIAAQKELEGYTRAQAKQYAEDLANDPARLRSEAELILTRTKLNAALIRETIATEGMTDALVSQKMAKMERDLAVREQLTSTPEGVALLQASEQQRRFERDIRANPSGEGRRTFVGNLRDKLGYSQGGETLTEFFGGGALASLRYGLPSMLMYGVGSGIMNTIKEAEELQYNLSRLEGQFESTFGGAGDFDSVRNNILNVAKDTGLAADEIANLQIQLTGAFGKNIKIDGLRGEELIEEQVESAAKLAQTIGLPLKEITDGLTAASLAFNASFKDIGNVALALEQESGVLARETVSFIGDIAPVAQEAGYSLEEFSAIAAVAQQRSGRSGAALAESFGRVIPALTEQKDKLMEIAALEPGLQNDGFIDAIRSSDPRAILEQIGRSYENMSKEAQQATISLLGGRREAQAIIPAITNQSLIERFTKDAEAAEGTLEDRFSKIQETLTNTTQRFQESLRQLGVAVLELGLADAFENAIDSAKLFLGVLTPLLEAINGVNKAFGGFPLSVLAGLAALKAFNRFVLQRPAFEQNQYGLQVPIRDERGRQQREYRLSREDFAFENRPRPIQQYQDLRYSSVDPITGIRRPGRVQGALVTQNMSRARALATTARGAGTDLLAGIGGGSVALGAGFVGITALASLYGWANQQVEKEKENLAELREEIDKGNQALDLTVPEIKSRRVEDLKAQAADFAKEGQGFWDNFTGEASEAEIALAEAYALETTEGFDDAMKALDASRSLSSDIFDKYGARLGQNTGGLRDMAARYKELVDSAGQYMVEDIDGGFTLVAPDGSKSGYTPITGKDAQYVRDLANRIGVKPKDIDFGFVEATLQKDSTSAILNLAKGETEAVNKYGADAVENAQAYVEQVFGFAATDPEFERDIEDLLKDLDELPPLEDNQLQLEQLKAGFDSGVIGIREYASRVLDNLKSRRRILEMSDQTASTELQILQVLQREQQAYAEFAQALIGRQEQDLEVQSLISGEGELGQLSKIIENNIANLNNPVFQSKDARRKAALDIITAEKTLAIEQAKRTGDINEIINLLNSGVNISAPASATLMVQDLNNNEDFVKIKEQIKSQFNELFAIEDIDAFYQRIFQDVLDDGVLSSNNTQGLNSMMSEVLGKMNAGSFESLGAGEQQDIMQSFDQIVVLMDFAGIGRDKILEALRRKKGNQNLTPEQLNTELDEILSQGLLPDPKQQANFDNKEALDAISFAYRDDIRNAKGNTVAKALYKKDEADKRLAELKRREAAGLYVSADDMESALDAQASAEAELRDAFQTAESAKLNYYATINRINGDLIGAMGQELAAIKVQIEAAKANQDWVAVANLMGQEALKLDEIRKQNVADANSFSQLNAGLATLNGDTIAAALFGIQEAQNNVDAARTTEEKNSAQLALAQAYDALRRAQADTRNRDFDVWAALMEFEGNTVAAAITRVKQAEYQLSIAKPGDETAQAQMALMNAQTALRQAQAQERDAAYRLFGAEIAGQDPVAQAKVDLALAKEQLKYAKGTIEQANARVAVIEAQRALNEAMNDARYSVYNLRQAELQAMGDDVGAAQVAAELARQQLNDAIKAGAGTAAVNNARASFISADKAAKDAVFQDRMDEYKWLLDMGRISKSQYINYLDGLKSTLIPGTKQFKDLELTIKQLKDDVGGDLQANLPTSLRLPTLYEVKRFDQTPQMGTGYAGIGYQDNRQVSINVEINDASQDTASIVVKTLEDALGTGRNGYGQRRF